MKSYRQEMWFNTPTRRAFLNISPQVQEALRASGIREGLLESVMRLQYRPRPVVAA